MSEEAEASRPMEASAAPKRHETTCEQFTLRETRPLPLCRHIQTSAPARSRGQS